MVDTLLQNLAETGTLRSHGRTLSYLAVNHGTRPAVIMDDGETISFEQLDRASNRLARSYSALGVQRGDFVTVALPNSVEFVTSCFAIWKLGCTPALLSNKLPFLERDEIVRLTQPRLAVGIPVDATHESVKCLPIGYEADAAISDLPLPDTYALNWKAPTSGGSTGRPKLIVAGAPSLGTVDAQGRMLGGLPTIGGGSLEGVKLITGPLYHSGPFNSAVQAILAGGTVVVMRRFDAAHWASLVSRHRCDWSYLVPTMMKRIWELPGRPGFDVSSLQAVMHTAAPCPPWLKEKWCEWLGPEKVYEMFGMSEGLLFATIRGDEWLKRKRDDGTNLVGRLQSGAVRVLDPSGSEVPPLTMGELFMRSSGSYKYVGAASQKSDDGWESLGDMGMMDAEGFIFLGDRKKDMLLVGGSNVFPAEVEAAIEQHPAVSSAAVVGLADADLGQRLHAIVYLARDVSDAVLVDFVSQRLSKQKVPRTWERVDSPVRGDDGKVRRSALAAARTAKL